MTPGRVFPGPGWAWNVRYSSSSGSAAAAISASIAGRVFHELMKKEITEGPAGRGEEGARQNLNEHGGEFHPRSPSAPRVGVDFLGGDFLSFSPRFSVPHPGRGCSLPGQGVPPTHPARPALIVPNMRRFVSSTGGRWRILAGRSCPHY